MLFQTSHLVLKLYNTARKVYYLHVRNEEIKTPRVKLIKETRLIHKLILQSTYSAAFSTVLYCKLHDIWNVN